MDAAQDIGGHDRARSGATPQKIRKKKNKYSFTADSPYFTSYVDKEMKNLNVLTETLQDISSKAKTFGKCGVLMSEATRRLSQSCKLQSAKGNNDNDSTGQISDKERSLIAERKASVGECSTCHLDRDVPLSSVFRQRVGFMSRFYTNKFLDTRNGIRIYIYYKRSVEEVHRR